MSAPILPAGVVQADGVMPVGSQVLTLNGVTYVANTVNLKRGSQKILRKDQYGLPSAETLLVQQFTGDAELQLATWATVPPVIGQTFDLLDAGGVTVHAKVTDVSPKFKQDGETMVSIEFNQNINHAA